LEFGVNAAILRPKVLSVKLRLVYQSITSSSLLC